MNTLKIKQLLAVLFVLSMIQTQAQTNKSKDQSSQNKSSTVISRVNDINGGMPNRISMNVTVPKQTQGATFGEKVNAGLHAAGKTIGQETSLRGIITGSITWNSQPFDNEINTAAVSSVGNLAGGAGGGAAAASYARSVEENPSLKGAVTTIYVKEGTGNRIVAGAIAGIAIAAVISRETSPAGIAGGVVAGRQQYQPVFFEGEENVCTDCMAKVHQNPYFQENGMAGEMPREQNKSVKAVDDDCDGVEGLTVSLVNEQTGAVVASIKTESCGDFFFENLPQAVYVLKFGGEFISKKSYDISFDKKGTFDVAGELLSANNQWTIKINTGLAENPSGGEKVNAGLHAAGGALSQGASLLGGSLPGGAVISAAVSSYSPGDPIPGLDVKLGKSSTEPNITSKTNAIGQFEFTGLSQGNYNLSSTLHFYIDSSIPVNLWLSKKGYDYYKAQSDQNKTSEEVKRKGIQENGLKKNESENTEIAKGKKGLNAVNVKTSKTDDETKNTPDETQRKGWDGTVKGGSKIEIVKEDDSEKIDKSDLTTAERNLQDCKNSFVDLEKLMEKDKRQSGPSNKITIQVNTVRNRISQLESSLRNLGLLGKNSVALSDLDIKLTAMERDFYTLLEYLNQMGDQYSSISNVLKTKHDTAKNSVGNIR